MIKSFTGTLIALKVAGLTILSWQIIIIITGCVLFFFIAMNSLDSRRKKNVLHKLIDNAEKEADENECLDVLITKILTCIYLDK